MKKMATLISLPEVLQSYISDFLRPHPGRGSATTPIKVDPLLKAQDVANIKAVHRNFQAVPLWKNHEWKTHIREWYDKYLTNMRWKYQYGTLSVQMIEKGWERKVNNDYRHQNCYVETMWGKGVGTGFVTELKYHKVIWFEVSLHDLITGIRPLPHCFGNDGRENRSNGIFQAQITSDTMVPMPSLETLIPIDKRREWLIECFMECVIEHWGKKMINKNGIDIENSDFIKEFKKMMDLPPNYELSQTQLFRMFLRELNVVGVEERVGVRLAQRSQSIDELCRQEINLVK